MELIKSTFMAILTMFVFAISYATFLHNPNLTDEQFLCVIMVFTMSGGACITYVKEVFKNLFAEGELQ